MAAIEKNDAVVDEKGLKADGVQVYEDSASLDSRQELLAAETDAVLARKMHLVNNAIDELGWTSLQTKLFILNGFGYAVDSLIVLVPSIVVSSVTLEYPPPGFPRGSTIGQILSLVLA